MSVGEEVIDGELVTSTAMIPHTGELLDLGSMSYEQLGAVLDDARQFEKGPFAEFKRAVTAEILGRMDARAAEGEDGAWTIHAEGMEITGDSPNRTEYDLNQLREALKQLVADGKISQAAADKCIVPERWKVAKRALQQTAKVSPEVKAAIDACEQPSTQPRYVTVRLAVPR